MTETANITQLEESAEETEAWAPVTTLEPAELVEPETDEDVAGPEKRSGWRGRSSLSRTRCPVKRKRFRAWFARTSSILVFARRRFPRYE